jgi:hypothetical protein
MRDKVKIETSKESIKTKLRIRRKGAEEEKEIS